MKFSWNSIRSAVLISLGLTMIIMGVAWAIDPLPTAPAAPPTTVPLIAAPAIAPGAPTGMGTTTIPISNEAPGVADADTEIVESEVTEEIPSPNQPGKKIKRKRKVRRRIKRRRKRAGKRTGMKFPHRIKNRSASPIGMHPSKMSPQQRKQWEIARRNYLVRAQQQRALMRIQRTPTSNLAKLRARQMQQLPPGAKKRGSRKTVGMTPSKSKGKSRKARASKAQGSQATPIDAQANDTSQPADESAHVATADTGQDEGTTDTAPTDGAPES